MDLSLLKNPEGITAHNGLGRDGLYRTKKAVAHEQDYADWCGYGKTGFSSGGRG
jgi:hypothetical protein